MRKHGTTINAMMDNVLVSDFFFTGLRNYGFLEGVCSHFCLADIPVRASGEERKLVKSEHPLLHC